ncbi:glycosyltransferase family 39 protein [Hymenobacter radiodurans]|uniref:glycosyltransferase family 39 protein n=1 Tax=Hymenobacter radiodurans TaxID=2496028 RepID=UPI00105905B2|nr:glycosyltransferase family 39 protein [Hymenobacter radiodurans]
MPSSRSFLQLLLTARGVVSLFFGLLILTGVLLHRDYGVSIDEPNNHLNGLVSAKYLAQLVVPELVARQPTNHLIPDIRSFRDADHGVAFELPMVVVSYLFTRHDAQAYYYLRHLLIFFLFVLGVWALYRLGTRWFGDWRWGLLGAGLLVLSPRFFAEAFYNGKDIVYMAFFTLAIYTLVRLLYHPTRGRALVHGLATALAVDVRVQGVLLLVVTLVMLGLEAVNRPATELPRRRVAGVAALYVAAALIFIIIGWPYLWATPLPELLNVSRRISQYSLWPGRVVYFGQVLPGTQLPWHYIPVWISLTTPLPYLLAAGLGLAATLRRFWRGGWAYWRAREARLSLLLLLWLLTPLVLVIALHAVVYNGWRHLYFLYPALLLFAVQGLRALLHVGRHSPSWAGRGLAVGLVAAGGLEVGHTVWRMIRLHPHQQVYFSFLPAPAVEQQFDRDYWGLAYRQGLEWVLAHDPSPSITYSGDADMLYCAGFLLPPAQKARLQYIWKENQPAARYFLTNHRPRNYSNSYPDSMKLWREVHTIRAEGLPILTVYQQKR